MYLVEKTLRILAFVYLPDDRDEDLVAQRLLMTAAANGTWYPGSVWIFPNARCFGWFPLVETSRRSTPWSARIDANLIVSSIRQDGSSGSVLELLRCGYTATRKRSRQLVPVNELCHARDIPQEETHRRRDDRAHGSTLR